MTGTTVGIRDLKAKLSAYIQQVKDGATLVITERGKPVGRIVPVRASLEERLQEMAQAGLVGWSGNKLKSIAPVARARGGKSVSDLLLEDRE